MKWLLTTVPLAMLFGASSYGAELKEVHVRVIDSKTAQPKSSVDVQVYVFGGAGARPDLYDRTFKVQTDQTGTASFTIDLRTEPRLEVAIQYGCSAPTKYDVAAVLLSGAIGKNQCWHTSPKLKVLAPRAGEIIVFRDRMSFWQALKHTGDVM